MVTTTDDDDSHDGPCGIDEHIANLTDRVAELRTLVNNNTPPVMVTDPDVPAPDVPDVPAPEDPAMPTTRPELPAFLLAALCVIGVIILTLHGDTVPDILNIAMAGALGTGAAITQVHK